MNILKVSLFMLNIINLLNSCNSLNIKMCVNNNNNNNYNLQIKKLKNGGNNNLILLNHVITSEWCKNWIYEMTLYKKDEKNEYPQFMYSDMMSMRIYCETNQNNNYFYIGYVPTNIDAMNGPLYIGAFKLIEGKRIFNIEKIIQNPNNDIDKVSVLDFRNDLYELAKQTNCIMNIKTLKNYSDNRYWFDFLLY